MTTPVLAVGPSREGDALFRSLIEHVSDIIAVLDADGCIRYVSPAAQTVLGIAPDELTGADALDVVHPDDQPGLVAALASLQTSTSIELRLQHRDGSWRWLSVAVRNLVDDPAVGGFLLCARDISGQMAVLEHLERQAYTDGLTGLPNRLALMDRLAQALDARTADERASSSVALLFIDIDRFKVINDSLGHRVGDMLLTAVSERLLATVSPETLVSRFGGDEFIILLADVDGAVNASNVAARVLDAMRAPFRLDGHEVISSASVGIAVATVGQSDADTLLQQADIALHQAKAEGKARAIVFDRGRDAPSLQRLELESDLWKAVERNELRLVYQPSVDLKTGSIVGMEALARWQHPRRGMVSPAEFIPVAEETGLILPVGRWVLQEACRQVRRWQHEHPNFRRLVMSVNVSAQEFQHPNLVQQVSETLRDTGLHPSSLKLEITESALLKDVEATLDTLHALHRLGVRIALDDFGTGYSSLNYLRRFPVDTLKIDRSFVQELGSSSSSLAIVRAVIALAHALEMDVTAEGFETSTQLARLRDAYCDHGQGYYFSKPLPVDQMNQLLASMIA